MKSGNKRLLILSCSARKTNEKSCKAIDRYLSPAFSVYRKWLWGNQSSNTVVWIVSALYGLIDSEKPIETYDLRLTPERGNFLQSKLKQQVRILNKFHFGEVPPTEVFGHLPKEYTELIDHQLSWSKPVPVKYAAGRPGIKLQQLKSWLEQERQL